MADSVLTQVPWTADAPAETLPAPQAAALTLPWWRTPPAIHGALAFLAAFAFLQAAFVVHVHHDYEGKFHGPFLPAHYFGMPQVELDQGYLPVCGGKELGWDGQFYYHMSHDPLILEPNSIAKHMDTPSYRYQRVGVPLIAWSVARITGQSFTSAFLYHTVQIALTAFGFGVLVGWLSAMGLAWGWSLCWLFGGGVLFSLFRGMPDAPADGMFIAALASLYYRRLGWYSVFASLACLIREGYVIVAFVVFMASILNRYSWDGSPGFLRRAILTALPGVLVVGWMAYVSWAFSRSPTSARAPGLYGLPFAAFLSCLERARMKGDIGEVRWLLVSASLVLTVLVSGIMSSRKSFLAVCAAGYAFLIASLGTIVWEDFCGHSKAITGVAIFGIILLNVDSHPFRRAALQLALIANLFVGLERGVIAPLVAPGGFHEFDAAQAQAAMQSPPKGEQLPTASDCRSKIVWVNPTSEYVIPAPWYLRRVHRSRMLLTVDVTNESSIPWIGNRNGHGAVRVGVQILDGKRVVVETRANLTRDVMPGETIRLQAAIYTGRPRPCVLRIGLLQDGSHWFHELGQTDVVENLVIR